MNLLLVMGLCMSQHFIQKEYIPYGAVIPNGRLLASDFDRDGKADLIFTARIDTLTIGLIWRREGLNNYLPRDTLGYYLNEWATGDFDGDGLYDVVTDGSHFTGMSVFESPDSFSYPIQEVWRDTVGFGLVQPISVFDINRDSYPEIIKLSWQKIDSITVNHPFGIYQTSGDNQYDTVFMSNMNPNGTLCSTMAFGDFDLDNHNEFIVGNNGGYYEHWEWVSGNNYQRIDFQSLPTVNIKDCFSVPDADQDGKPEFVVKGFRVGGTVDAYIFEAVANDTYAIISEFHPQGGDYYGGYSEAGDVDSDSIPEIVLEARQRVYIIKAGGNDSFYIWDTLPGHVAGSCVRIFDLDGNGLNDIIISGGDETRIYEYSAGSVNDYGKNNIIEGISAFPNPFTNQITIKWVSIPILNATIEIFDINGKVVFNFNPKHDISRQSNRLIWKGYDNKGINQPAGIYFVVMTDPGKRKITQKIIKLIE